MHAGKRGNGRAKKSVVPPEEVDLRTRHQLFVDGILQVEDLDLDELQKGRVKNHEGKFPRGVPLMPLGLQARIHREMRKRLLEEFHKYGIDAIETITEVMYRGEGASAFQGQKDGTKRLDAAKYVIERIVGPIPTKSEVSVVATPWEQIQESQGLFIDVDVTDIQEVEDVQTPEPAARKRGPRTRPRKKEIEVD